jgi:hypothetical protein
MKIQAYKTRVYKEGEDIISFIVERIPRISEGSIIAVTSKIVALSEGRTALITSAKDKDTLIKKESSYALRTKLVWLTIKDGTVMANAGIDESNANGKIILLPKDSYKSARYIRRKLAKHYGVKKIGVLITDSRLMPLRAGVVGVALGYAGYELANKQALEMITPALQKAGIDVTKVKNIYFKMGQEAGSKASTVVDVAMLYGGVGEAKLAVVGGIKLIKGANGALKVVDSAKTVETLAKPVIKDAVQASPKLAEIAPTLKSGLLRL